MPALTILGSGTAISHGRRNPSSHLLRSRDFSVLLDCGSGATARMTEVGFNLMTLDLIAITHHHADHISDLAPLIQALDVRGFYYPPREKALWVVGFKGLAEYYRSLRGKALLKNSVFPIHLHEVKKHRIRIGNFCAISSTPVAHTETSVAYRVTLDGATVAYTGDANAVTPNLVKLVKDADCLIANTALPHEWKLGRPTAPHLSVREGAELAAKAGVKRLVLSHFYPPCEKANISAEARKVYKGKIILSKDKMMIKL